MSLVDRLAEKWDNHVLKQKFPYGVDPRWWLNAIADELDAQGELDPPDGKFVPTTWWRCSSWLRAQAEEKE